MVLECKMKLFVRLAILSFVFYFLIQYSISTRIDADIDERYLYTAADNQISPEPSGSELNGTVTAPSTVNLIDTLKEPVAGPAGSPEYTKPAGTAGLHESTEPAGYAESPESTEPAGYAGSPESVSPTEFTGLIKPADSIDPDGSKDPQADLNDELASCRGLPYFISGNSDGYIAYKLKNPDLPYETVVTYVNIGLDKPFYTDINVVNDPDSLTVLVNKYNQLPDDYIPKLSQIDPAFSDPVRNRQYLRPEAKAAFEKMCKDAKALGLNILAYGTYRSISDQTYIWKNKIKEYATAEGVDNFHARGGHSEHNTGLAVDVMGIKYTVEETWEFQWYKENAHKYGFILRYPADKKNITGYSYEPWHLRYVGEETAAAVYESGLSYDEYYTCFKSPYE